MARGRDTRLGKVKLYEASSQCEGDRRPFTADGESDSIGILTAGHSRSPWGWASRLDLIVDVDASGPLWRRVTRW